MEGNTGDDIAGTVHAVGSKVVEFKKGDRVAAFHEMRTSGGSFAEYAVAWKHTTFHLPANISFQEAATLPLAALTAAVGLYLRLGLPEPWSPAKPKEKQAILVYGAASAVGAFAIQLAQLSELHPIIGIAGRGIPFAETLIDKSKGDTIIDYRNGDDAVVQGIKDALKAAGCDKINYCFDGISENGSHENIAAILDTSSPSFVTHVLPPETFARTKGFKYPEGIEHSLTQVGCVHDNAKDFGHVWSQFFTRLLEDGRFKAHPYEEREGGLRGVSQALKDLKDGKASAVKYVFEISRTEGLEQMPGSEGNSTLEHAVTGGFRV
jgi:NADPH2:quinone reductase